MPRRQRMISKIITGLVFISLFISSASAVDFTANIVPENTEILSTNPSGDISFYTEEYQDFSAILNNVGNSNWYLDGELVHTDLNTVTPGFYFTISTTGVFNLTLISTDSITSDSFTWFLTVISTDEFNISAIYPIYPISTVRPTPPPYKYDQVEDESLLGSILDGDGNIVNFVEKTHGTILTNILETLSRFEIVEWMLLIVLTYLGAIVYTALKGTLDYFDVLMYGTMGWGIPLILATIGIDIIPSSIIFTGSLFITITIIGTYILRDKSSYIPMMGPSSWR